MFSKNEREKYHVDYHPDTEFSAFARLLQSNWRASKNLDFNKYGNFIQSEFAVKDKANLLTPKIRVLAEYEVLRKNITKKLIKEIRMWENLLSSQPLCFNLFGEFHFDLKLATKFFNVLFPDRVQTVTDVIFEHSPGRGNKNFTGDHSAFDVFIEYTNGEKRGFIGIEVKYAESFKEESVKLAETTFKQHESEYTRLTSTDIFHPGAIDILKTPPLSQIWRDHLLSLATRQIYDEGFFVFLFPSKNSQCQRGVDEYKKYIVSDIEAETGFYPRHLESFISILLAISGEAWVSELKTRYLGD